MTKKKEIFRQTGLYSGATLLTQLITLVAAVVTRRFLGPVQTGIWALLQVILQYAPYTAMGTPEAVTREIPFYIGKKDEAKADEIRDNVFTFAMGASIAASAMVLGTAFIFRSHIRPELFWGLLFTAGLVILQRLNNLLIALLRAYKYFGLAGQQMVWSALVNAALVATLSFYFKIYGFMWAMCLSFLFNIAFIAWHRPFEIHWRFTYKKILPLIGFGLPLMLLGLANVLFISIDKLMVAKMLGLKELGFYSIAVLAYQYLEKLPASVGMVLVPHFHEKYGEREKAEDLKNYVLYPARFMSLLIPLLTGCAWFLAPPAIKWILPDFLPAVPALRCLVLGTFFLSTGQTFSQLIIATRRHMALFPIVLGTTLLAVILNYAALASGWGIIGVALATLTVIFLRFSLLYLYSAKAILRGWLPLSEYMVLVRNFLLALILLWGLSTWRAELFDPVSSIVNLGIFLPAFVLLWFATNRSFHLLEKLNLKLPGQRSQNS